jgi:hypothetical protein
MIVTYGLMFVCEKGHFTMLDKPVTSVLFMFLFSLWYVSDGLHFLLFVQ